MRNPANVCVLCAPAVALALFAGASDAASGKTQERTREDDLREIQQRIEELHDELADLDKAEIDVESELRRLDLQSTLQRQMVEEAKAERTIAEESLRSSNERAEVLEAELAATRERLAKRIAALYKATPTDWLRGFVSIRVPADLFLYLRTLRFLARRDGRLLPVYLEQRAELAAERRRLEERRREVAESVARERARLARLAAARRKQTLVASALDRARERLALEQRSLDDKQRKLTLLIAVLADPEESSLAGAPIQDFRGALDWPVSGAVTVPFGPRYERRYGTSVPHNGVRIAPEDAEVRAVYPGKVIFAAPFEGFGLTVVLHHSRKVFSLHAGLDELEVAKDDVVLLGGVLGRTRSPLYFEIRVENRPEDPMEWLR